MFEKIIIENRTTVPMLLIMDMVKSVIAAGRISKTSKGEQYCFGSKFTLVAKDCSDIVVMVWTDKNKKSDRFVIDYS